LARGEVGIFKTEDWEMAIERGTAVLSGYLHWLENITTARAITGTSEVV
jgi:hypothetical protein